MGILAAPPRRTAASPGKRRILLTRSSARCADVGCCATLFVLTRPGFGSRGAARPLFEHDLFPKTGSHFSGSCIWLRDRGLVSRDGYPCGAALTRYIRKAFCPEGRA